MNAENIVDFTLELSEREIYNDIRTECDILEILTVRPDATPEFMRTYTLSQTKSIRPGQTEDFEFTGRANQYAVHFTEVWISGLSIRPLTGYNQGSCEAIENGTPYQGVWEAPLCYVTPRASQIHHYNTTYSTDRSTAWAYVTNNYDRRPWPFTVEVTMTARYLALDPAQRYIKLRSMNETSMELYGRRPMDLVWPLGQHPNQMQGILDRYCQRHCMVTQDEYGDVPEPICTAKATIAGKNEELAEDLLTYRIASHISVRGDTFAIPLVHPSLGLDGHRWYINAINITDHVEGILEGTFELEQQRAMERPRIFRLQSDPPDADRDSRLYDATPEENHVLG